ncbi:hypothetical protein [Ralstonia sp. UBA689]|uniref:hypothetical protein n=1 Tax=Ralstonia sp. UBA689 TaxID=1947373 RepID=UPI0025E6CBE8|nr:hypothetical protein [Ralstonia sp. UBA689]
MQPVHQFHIWITSQLAESGGAFDCFEKGRVKSAKQGLTGNIHSTIFIKIGYRLI